MERACGETNICTTKQEKTGLEEQRTDFTFKHVNTFYTGTTTGFSLMQKSRKMDDRYDTIEKSVLSFNCKTTYHIYSKGFRSDISLLGLLLSCSPLILKIKRSSAGKNLYVFLISGYNELKDTCNMYHLTICERK